MAETAAVSHVTNNDDDDDLPLPPPPKLVRQNAVARDHWQLSTTPTVSASNPFCRPLFADPSYMINPLQEHGSIACSWCGSQMVCSRCRHSFRGSNHVTVRPNQHKKRGVNICYKFNSPDGCQYGPACRYPHAAIRCEFFATNTCRYDGSCRWMHTRDISIPTLATFLATSQ